MNVYRITTPAISACVLAEHAEDAIDCFVEKFSQEYFGMCECDINCVEQIACENQPRYTKTDFPDHLIIDIDSVYNWLSRKGYKVTRKDE